MTITPRFALVSHYLPPSRYGQPRVIYRLLQNLPANQYGLISIYPYDRTIKSEEQDAPWLQGPYFKIDPGFPLKQFAPSVGPSSLLRAVYTFLNLFGALIKRSYAISQIVKREDYNCIIACSGDPIDIPASYLAARRLNLPFFTYMFDDYGSQYKIIPLYQKFSGFWDRLIAKETTGIIVPNEMLHEDYVKRSNIVPCIVRNPLRDLPNNNNYPWPFKTHEIKIIYTGSIYHVHEDAFARLVKVLERFDEPISLHLYCSVPTQDMPLFKRSSKVFHHHHVSDEEATKLQERADILFLPLAFQSPTPEVIRTALPGKFAEYLASGRPILVHAPKDSFISWYCRQKECAVVIDEDNEDALYKGINQIIKHSEVRAQITQAAQKQAREEFNPLLAQTKFLEYINKSIITKLNHEKKDYKLNIFLYICRNILSRLLCRSIMSHLIFGASKTTKLFIQNLIFMLMKITVARQLKKLKL